MFVSRIVFRVTHSRTGFGFRKSQPSRTQAPQGRGTLSDLANMFVDFYLAVCHASTSCIRDLQKNVCIA